MTTSGTPSGASTVNEEKQFNDQKVLVNEADGKPIENFNGAVVDTEKAQEDGVLEDEKAPVDEKPAAPAGPDPKEFPDGGLKAWSVVFGGWCCLFASFGWINCIGVFQTYYQENFLSTYTPSQVAWISSSETFMMFVGAPVFGKIYDNFGCRGLLAFGTFFHVFGLMMLSLSTQYYQVILAQSFCSALGASALFFAATNPVATWFFKRRAFAFGIMASGSSLAGVVLP
jgi:hypothetical protein